jgi:hypothetical protein
MLKRDEGRARSNPKVGPAPRAFMQLSADGSAELEETSPRRKAAAILLSFLVLLAVPFYLAAMAHGSGGDQPLAVKSNSGPGSDDDDDEDSSGPGSDGDDDDTPTGTTPNTGPSNTATNDTATGTVTTTGADAQGATATGTTQGTGPSNTNTNDTATGTRTRNDD